MLCLLFSRSSNQGGFHGLTVGMDKAGRRKRRGEEELDKRRMDVSMVTAVLTKQG